MSSAPPPPPPAPVPSSPPVKAKAVQAKEQVDVAEREEALFRALEASDFALARTILAEVPTLAHARHSKRRLLLLHTSESVFQCAARRGGDVAFVEELMRLPFNVPVVLEDACAKLAWDAGNDDLAQFFASREAELAVSVSFLQLNCMLDNDAVQLTMIARLIKARHPDVVGLQEITPRHVAALHTRDLLAMYDFHPSGALESSHDSLLLVRKSLHATFETQPLAQNQRRHVRFATFTAHGRRVTFATAHLESQFFNEPAERIKGAQLAAIGERLRAIGSDVRFMTCDSNLTGGWLLELDNALMANAGFVDAWLVLHAPNEAEPQSKNWKSLHATWAGSRNGLVKHRHEHHRPDRVLLQSGCRALHVEMVCGEPKSDDPLAFVPYSDHFGLLGRVCVAEEK